VLTPIYVLTLAMDLTDQTAPFDFWRSIDRSVCG
jgi:hypothetical protein